MDASRFGKQYFVFCEKGNRLQSYIRPYCRLDFYLGPDKIRQERSHLRLVLEVLVKIQVYVLAV